MFGIFAIVLAALQLQVSVAASDVDYANSTPVELLQAYVKIDTTTHKNLSKNGFSYVLLMG